VPVHDVRADRSLFLSAAVIAASSLVFPWVGGYGTVLFQVVTLNAWSLLAGLTSGRYADYHHGLLWTLALLLNVFLFLIPAVPWWFFTRRRWPSWCRAGLVVLCALYLGFLFYLWPATDGP
jgi:hypothetical protein